MALYLLAGAFVTPISAMQATSVSKQSFSAVPDAATGDFVSLFEVGASGAERAEASVAGPEPAVILAGELPERFPRQIIMTAKNDSFSNLSAEVMENVNNTMNMNPELSLRFLGDEGCLEYLNMYEPALADAFTQETYGFFRGDICRTVVLYQEGGVYVDLDVQPLVPFHQLVGAGSNATFVSANMMEVEGYRGILNAIMIATPKNPLVGNAIQAMIRHYDGYNYSQYGYDPNGLLLPTGWFMGPNTTWQGISDYWMANCGFEFPENEWNHCAGETVQLFREARCGDSPVPCPPGRYNVEDDPSMDYITQFVVNESAAERVAWSRFDGCEANGCGVGGHSGGVEAAAQVRSRA